MRVLITRAEPAASRTASSVSALGLIPLKLPLFSISDTGIEIPGENFDAFIFTSGNALDILEQRSWMPLNADAQVFCVGRRTAEKAAALGFANVVQEEGGARKLLPKILEADLPPDAAIAYFTTPDRSFDLTSELAKNGLHSVDLEIYRAEETAPDPQALRHLFEPDPPDVILSYSARSSDILAAALTRAGLEKSLSQAVLVAISGQAIGDLATFRWNETRVAPVANEQAMLHILKE